MDSDAVCPAVLRSLLLAGFGLLVGNRLDDVSQGSRLRIQAAHDLGDENLLARQVCQSLYALFIEERTVAHAAFNGDLLVLLCKVAEDLGITFPEDLASNAKELFTEITQ